ncbi:MAG: hypothetical protein HETSPECPRED_000734 [Heterodermia speciosa]|uniref:Anaphase-promoting complex subunit 4 WD40 domain-containing protein n=1 Tax=Heterodermia speciosa TaxID=116794 RepID=A0A8H3GD93_9LECA|nr:MAG: hypothetical protein HETSPECPRED_000734 [Heterodermia speciosa]
MADQEPTPTKRRASIRATTPDNKDYPLPTPATSGRDGARRPKQLPTVTPRRFKKFFTPRSSLRRNVKVGTSRQALRDITTGDSNRKSLGRRRSPKVDEVQIFQDGNEIGVQSSRKRKRLHPHTPEPTPELSSPIKRSRAISVEHLDIATEAEHGSPSSSRSIYDGAEPGLASVRPISRWRQDGLTGQRLQQEYGGLSQTRGRLHLGSGSDWQHETAGFFTRPDDSHACVNVAGTEPSHAIPFCTASCNTNSLVAIGDEEGGIRLLETDKTSEPSFSKTYLALRAHGNAILDLAFSPDDLLLATASGDRTTRIIDMPTQTATFTMAGHTSSVKQVRFRPGSSSVVATSSRDGGVLVWDLRCKGHEGPVQDIRVSLSGSDEGGGTTASERYASQINTIQEAHAPALRQIAESITKLSSKPGLVRDCPSRTEPQNRRGDVSVTALAFLPPGREHLLLTGSEANASVKLWDLRTSHSHRRMRATPLSSTQQPESHNNHRHFGLTSMALSGDGVRLYTVCRDNTVYAYSTSHLILGHAPELSLTAPRPRRSGGAEREGLGPLYGFRHPQFHATTFYVKSALRLAVDEKSELLAVGSSDGCAVLFPTDERYLGKSRIVSAFHGHTLTSSRPNLTRTDSGMSLFTRLNDTVPIYQHGTPLIRGHGREVTDMTWTYGGELVTIGDDLTARCWREGPDARDLRIGGETEGRRWGCGWSETVGDWDSDD